MIKKIIRKLIYGVKCNSGSYINYLRSIGAKIGRNVTFYAPMKTKIDITRPWLIEIGDEVEITEGVSILTHGYDWSVLKGFYGDVLGSSGKVTIGNNVFIGMNATILKGVSIGNNVIIGANSLVNKDVPDNCVAAGNPCKVIMTLSEYYENRKKAQLDEATELVQVYRERYGKEPNEKVLREFFWMFSDSTDWLCEEWDSVMSLHGAEELTRSRFREHKKVFKNMSVFLDSVGRSSERDTNFRQDNNLNVQSEN